MQCKDYDSKLIKEIKGNENDINVLQEYLKKYRLLRMISELSLKVLNNIFFDLQRYGIVKKTKGIYTGKGDIDYDTQLDYDEFKYLLSSFFASKQAGCEKRGLTPIDEKMTYDEYCVLKDKKEYTLKSLFDALKHYTNLNEHSKAVLAKTCDFLMHDYQKTGNVQKIGDIYAFEYKCKDCGTTVTLEYPPTRRELFMPHNDIEKYIHYLSSINSKETKIQAKKYTYSRNYLDKDVNVSALVDSYKD